MKLVHFTCKSLPNLTLFSLPTSPPNKYIKPNYDLINRNLLFRGNGALAGSTLGLQRISCTVKTTMWLPSEASSARALQTGPPGSVGGILRSKRHKPTDPYSRSEANRWETAVILAWFPFFLLSFYCTRTEDILKSQLLQRPPESSHSVSRHIRVCLCVCVRPLILCQDEEGRHASLAPRWQGVIRAASIPETPAFCFHLLPEHTDAVI